MVLCVGSSKMVLGLCRRLCGVFLVFGFMEFGVVDAALARDYVSGHGALQVWDAEGRAGAPLWVRIWLNIMHIAFATGLVFMWWRVEARWAVGGFSGVFVTATLSQGLTEIVALSGLLSLLHVIFWSPALYLLLTRRPFVEERSAYAVWSAFMTFVILFSFLFDVPGAAIYLDHVLGTGLLS